ncbi:MlaD family protein [Nocardia sp. NBC_00565]|uniref:MlaD family protein n=1 Tax=Nocardia sp. NBC_00565 TaxID=2975993 RepID=UPI002E81CF45|nr:MlaD family protein [Nocardia sp. NBC_00565]WUC06590.1 MlaD family protein [Nocardia sp. NBC_00565]
MTRSARSIKPGSLLSSAAIAAVLLAGIGYLSFGVLHMDPMRDHITVRMLLADSGGVGANSPVLLSGVRVGEVATVDTVPAGVEFRLRLDTRYRVPASSTVRIEAVSALGEPYVEFDPPGQTSPYLSDNQLLDTRGMPMSMSIPQVSVRAVQLLRQFDPATMKSLIGTIDTAITGTSGEMPRLERANTLLAATILSRSDLLHRLLTDMQTMGADMSWAGPSLQTSGRGWQQFGVSIDQLIIAASGLFEIDNSPTDYNTGDGMVPFLQRLNSVVGKTGPLVQQLNPMLEPLADTAVHAGADIDISSLISQALAMVGDDRAVRLRINVK